MYQRWADCEIVQSKSNPDPQKFNPIQSWSTKFLKIISPIQSWSTHVKPCILFCLMRQNRHNLMRQMRHNFWHFQNLIRQCLFCHQRQKHCWSYFAIRRTQLVVLQPLQWCCVDCVIHHERDVGEEQHHIYMWHEQAIIEWSWHVNSIVACCHNSAKLCAYAARDFRSQQ